MIFKVVDDAFLSSGKFIQGCHTELHGGLVVFEIGRFHLLQQGLLQFLTVLFNPQLCIPGRGRVCLLGDRQKPFRNGGRLEGNLKKISWFSNQAVTGDGRDCKPDVYSAHL